MTLTHCIIFTLLLTVSVASEDVRHKRGTVTLDFGLLLRNLLQKSAQFSSVKANITRNIINSKTPRPPPMMTTTTTTTPAPPPPPPPPPPRPWPRPYYGPGWWPRPYDYYPPGFDYDYGPSAPPAPPTRRPAPPAPPPPTAAPAPPVRVRPPPRPLHPFFDYDYDVDTAAAPAPPPPPPAPPAPPSRRPRPRPAPPAAPSAPPPQRRPRPRPQPGAQLGDHVIYQYAQPTDTFSKTRSFQDDDAATVVGIGAEAEQEQEQQPGITEQETEPEADNQNVDTDPTIQDNPGTNDVNPNRFLVNYPDDTVSGEDYFAQKRPFGLGSTGVGRSLDFANFNNFPSASTSPGAQQSTYY